MLIVDGKSVVAAGFNFEYYHYPVENPSGLGEDRWDLAMQISGPVAQDAMRAFDDLWQDSNGRKCNFHPTLDLSWETTCHNYAVQAVHVPEVLKYYLPEGGKAEAFSMYRTEVHPESDVQVVAVVAEAKDSIDLTHVNFTLALVCDLNVLYDVCNYHQSLPYYESLLTAAENGAHLRIMIEQSSIDGVEATIGMRIFLDEAARRGVSDRIELRFFNGWMHFKSVLVDDQFLVVGSQNFHYSAFGKNTGLAEYNLGTDDPQAIEDYKRFFEYQWERAVPVPE
jgi:cardiolipin synthase